MKRRWKTLLVAGVVAILVTSLSGVALAAGPPWKAAEEPGARAGQTQDPAGSCGASATAVGSLSEFEEQTLIYIREEEKLARDVYNALYEEWGVAQFSNIAASESRHMASAKRLLDRYGLADPAAEDTPGVFVNDDLQAAYDELVARGTVSVEDAFQVGVMIEQLDITDLQELIDATDGADITRVMENLLRGSQHHLAAFTALLAD